MCALQGLTAFLKANAKTPFTLPESVEAEDAAEVEASHGEEGAEDADADQVDEEYADVDVAPAQDGEEAAPEGKDELVGPGRGEWRRCIGDLLGIVCLRQVDE